VAKIVGGGNKNFSQAKSIEREKTTVDFYFDTKRVLFEIPAVRGSKRF